MIRGRGVGVVGGVIGVRYNERVVVGVGQGITSGIGSVSGRFIVSIEGIRNLDSDRDGIKDSVDMCVEDSEDKDGYKDEDGCPDMDNDGDGVMDMYDLCVGEVENRNGYKDSDGCLDEVDGVVEVSEIYFEKGGDGVVMGRSYPVLKRLVDIMGGRGRLEVVLSGGDIELLDRRGKKLVRELEGIMGVEGRVTYRVITSGEEGVEFKVVYGIVIK